jgi:zinc transport system substrate-binding protein
MLSSILSTLSVFLDFGTFILRYWPDMFLKKLSILIILLAGCAHAPQLPPENKKPLILVSIAPYKFLTERIAGEDFEVQTIIPSRSNPHSFEPTARQVLEISRGQVWFSIGEPFEAKVLPLLQKSSPSLVVADLRDGIELKPFDESHHVCHHCSSDSLDRHIWLSPRLAGKQAANIAKVLSDRFPEKKEEFQKNLQNCLAELEKINQEIQTILTPLQERSILVSHSAFGYFCLEYGLEQLSVEQEGKDARPRYLEEMLAKARKSHTAIALALPQHNNKGAQVIADEMNIPIRLIDPYSADYFDTLLHLARLIADPLQKVP